MCIIIVKEKGKQLPSKETLRTCFNEHSDGAGFMYATADKLYVEKGLMGFKQYYKKLREIERKLQNKVEETPFIFHFRTATTGSVKKTNTHPFLVFENLGMAHNGVLGGYSKVPEDITDTQQYIDAVVRPGLMGYHYINNEIFKIIIDKTSGFSKLAFLDASGYIATFGMFHERAEDGLKYSNYSYVPTAKYSGYNWSKNNSVATTPVTLLPLPDKGVITPKLPALTQEEADRLWGSDVDWDKEVDAYDPSELDIIYDEEWREMDTDMQLGMLQFYKHNKKGGYYERREGVEA